MGGEPARIYETHCHIHDREAFPDPISVISRAREAGIGRINIVGVGPGDWETAVELAEHHEDVYAICGWHPNYTLDYDEIQLPHLIRVLRHPKVVALGEIGLDFHWEYWPPFQQRKALLDQLRVAEDLAMPVVFHAREAYSELLDILEKRPPRPYLFHCFTGNKDELRRILRLGGIIGVDGPVTYKNAGELRDVIALCPPHKLVFETDSPYMAPMPHRGKQNEPALLPHIVSVVAELQQISVDELIEITTETALDFFQVQSN